MTSAPITCSTPTGRPIGTDLTFFDFPAAPERRGTNAISRTGLRRGRQPRLLARPPEKAGGVTGDVVEVDGRLTLPLKRRGSAPGAGRRWRAGTASPGNTASAIKQIRGLGRRADHARAVAPAFVLTEVMNMRRVRDYAASARIHVFEMGGGGPAAELHVLEDKECNGATGRRRHPPRRSARPTRLYHAWAGG
jgi:glyoxalase family protein